MTDATTLISLTEEERTTLLTLTHDALCRVINSSLPDMNEDERAAAYDKARALTTKFMSSGGNHPRYLVFTRNHDLTDWRVFKFFTLQHARAAFDENTYTSVALIDVMTGETNAQRSIPNASS